MDILDVGDSSVELFGLSTFHPPVYFLAAAQKTKRSCAAFFFVSIPILLTCLKALYETLLVLDGGAEPETMLKLNCADTTSPCPTGIDDETLKL